MVLKQSKLNLKSRALRSLSLREHSRLELGRKLARYAENSENVEVLLDFLENKGLLSDERFSESLIRRRAKDYGNQRIFAELQTHGIDKHLSQQSKAELAESEVVRARAVWQKKFGHRKQMTVRNSGKDTVDQNAVENFCSSTKEERSKQVRYLMQRGFSGGAIKVALETNFDESDVIE